MATRKGIDSKKMKARSSGYKTKRGNQRRDALLNATKEMIALDGVSEISFVSIAKNAGIPLSSAYHYFQNLDALITKIVEELCDKMLRRLYSVKIDEKNSSEENLRLLIGETVDFFNQDNIAQKVFYASSLPDSAKAIDGELLRKMSDLYYQSINMTDRIREKDEFYGRFIVATQLFDAVVKYEFSNQAKISSSAVKEIKTIVTSYLLS